MAVATMTVRAASPIPPTSSRPLSRATARALPEISVLHRYISSTACRWLCPKSMSRWWMCSLSAWVTGRPRRIRRRMARTTSRKGTARMTSGTRTGIENAARSPPDGGTKFRPTPEIVAAARSSPSSIDPESPMKIRAGWKFQGRNPRAPPAASADSSGAVRFPDSPELGAWTTYVKNAMAAMATIPAARPSRPSMRFTAFTIPTTHTTVRGTARSEPSTRRPWPGKKKYRSWTPNSTSSPAARSCPASFTGAAVPRTSSTTPIRTSTAPATRAPAGSSDVRNRARNAPSWWATTMPASTARKMASPPMVGVGRGWTFRSDGWSTAPILTASHRTAGVVANETTNAVPNTMRNGFMFTGPLPPWIPVVGPSPLPGVGREPGREVGHAAPGRLPHGLVPRGAQDLPDDAGHLLHLGFVHPERGRARRPHPDPARRHRGQRVERDRVLVQRDPHGVARGLGVLPGDVERPEVHQREVGVRAAGHDPEALVGQAGGQGPGRPHDAVGVVGELRGHGLLQGHGLRCDAVLERAALHHREHRLVDGLRVLLPREDDRPAGSPERLVGGERHHVGMRDRRGVGAPRHQPDEVRGVHHEQRADLVGDPAESLEVDDPGVRREAGQDDLRPVLEGQVPDPVHVDELGGRIDLIVHEREPLAGEVHRGTVGEVAAVGQDQPQHGVVRSEERRVGKE